MAMRNSDFVAFILTHGRADRVYTYKTLRDCGYTGRIVLVIDNEDQAEADYRARYRGQIEVFDKALVASQIDEGDNFKDRRAIIYARNACFEIARKLGVTYFIELDDDYVAFNHKADAQGEYIEKPIRNLDAVLDAMLEYFISIPASSIAMAQGGDFIGGKEANGQQKPRRKCMNSFICSTKRQFQFFGRVNEDVNTYALGGSRGQLFLTVTKVELKQKQTQANAGGMTEMYLDSGTYIKSFYSVMYQPSSVKVAVMRSKNPRIHHQVTWAHTVPCILPEHFRRASDATH